MNLRHDLTPHPDARDEAAVLLETEQTEKRLWVVEPGHVRIRE